MKIIECPRDAMQGFQNFIPTEKKITYLNALLNVGFDTLDCGSFVSPKAIPQLADTHEVLQSLSISNTRLLTIIANERGALEACKHQNISYLGFPFSLSETFQQRNTNKSMLQSYELIKSIKRICDENNKQLVLYFSMGFGNPYEDIYSTDLLKFWAEKMINLNISIISIADTIGIATPVLISSVFNEIVATYPTVAWGAHFHSNAITTFGTIEAAYNAGCRAFDGALKGLGGCPFAADELVGNVATEMLIDFMDAKNIKLNINRSALQNALSLVESTFE